MRTVVDCTALFGDRAERLILRPKAYAVKKAEPPTHITGNERLVLLQISQWPQTMRYVKKLRMYMVLEE